MRILTDENLELLIRPLHHPVLLRVTTERSYLPNVPFLQQIDYGALELSAVVSVSKDGRNVGVAELGFNLVEHLP